MNDFNHYSGYNPYGKKERKSNTALVIFLFIFTLAVIVFASAFLYLSITDKYDKQIKSMDSMIQDYEKQLDSNDKEMINLKSVIDTFSTDYDKDVQSINNEINSLSTNYDNVSQKVSTLNGDFNISETAKNVSPAVIGIKVYVPSQKYNNFWSTQPSETSGSGIVLSNDGYIVTNYHVIADAAEYSNAIVTVVLSNGTEYAAKVTGYDKLNDLAVIKIDAKDLPYATLGSSSASNIGDFVIAIGNPLGIDLYGSVTFGIISGLNRHFNEENVAEELIQTDAAINPGNSGGALINYKGEIIGINTIKITESNVEGLGFAIPIDYAKPLIDSIIKYGYVKDRPTLGLELYDISKNVASYYGVPQGILVTGYDEATEKSDFKVNDIITKINDKAITTSAELEKVIKTLKVGSTVEVVVWRNDTTQKITVELMEKK